MVGRDGLHGVRLRMTETAGLRVGNLTVASYATCVSGFIRKLEIFLQEPDMRGALRGNIAARLAFMFL